MRVEDAAHELGRLPGVREPAPEVLLPAPVEMGEHALEVSELVRAQGEPVRLGREPARALPVAVVPGDHPAQRDQLADLGAAVGLDAFERRGGARDVAPRQTCPRLLDPQRRDALGGRGGDRLGVRGRGVRLARPVEELRAQREEPRALVPVGVRERLLGPLGAAAVGAHAGGPLGRAGEQRHRLARAPGAQEMARDRLGRGLLGGEQRGGPLVGAAQQLLRQAGRQRLAHEGVPEAVATARAIEHAGRDRVGEQRVDTAPARARARNGGAARAREGRHLPAVKPSSITASAASHASPKRSKPREPPRHHLAQPRRDGRLARDVHGRRQLLGEERVAGRRALDGGEHARLQRAACGPPDDRRERGAVERAERHLDGGAALEQARPQARGRLGQGVVAQGGDDEQPAAHGAAREVAHERRRRLVRGVRVVDRQDDAALGGRLGEQPRDRREDAVTVHGRSAGCATDGSSRASAARAARRRARP